MQEELDKQIQENQLLRDKNKMKSAKLENSRRDNQNIKNDLVEKQLELKALKDNHKKQIFEKQKRYETIIKDLEVELRASQDQNSEYRTIIQSLENQDLNSNSNQQIQTNITDITKINQKMESLKKPSMAPQPTPVFPGDQIPGAKEISHQQLTLQAQQLINENHDFQEALDKNEVIFDQEKCEILNQFIVHEFLGEPLQQEELDITIATTNIIDDFDQSESQILLPESSVDQEQIKASLGLHGFEENPEELSMTTNLLSETMLSSQINDSQYLRAKAQQEMEMAQIQGPGKQKIIRAVNSDSSSVQGSESD